MYGEKTNIIFIHRGNSKYLDYILSCAHKNNSEANIYLISDIKEHKYNYINHVLIDDYFENATKFAQIYRHMSTNEFRFELFCIQRWFVLNDFVKKSGLNNCFHADSDVLIYANIGNEKNKYSKYDFTLSESTCGHCSFWNNADIINRFTEFVKEIYEGVNNSIFNELKENWVETERLGKTSGVCDMTLLKLFQKQDGLKVGETALIENNSVYDHNISCGKQGGEQYRDFFGIKKIIWKNKEQYLMAADFRLIKLNCIHLQGDAKKVIKLIYNEKSYYLPLLLFIKIVTLFKIKFNIFKQRLFETGR